ncbi:hypothetical protein OG911_06135 [Streptomyces sp. NBC_00208]|uniref:hypothetical protein n=1 Tax=Streptomyces sp. NBC_00208 TaxID=2975681 RepID=UPI002E2E7952|nr:hypothetical protein [Streptomyces sp. NBC_00208]
MHKILPDPTRRTNPVTALAGASGNGSAGWLSPIEFEEKQYSDETAERANLTPPFQHVLTR